MATIRNAKARILTINYIGGKASRITLFPGVNLGIDDTEWKVASQHPDVAHWLEMGVLDVLKSEPASKGELLGLEVTENPVDDEPLPILEAEVSAPTENKTPRKPRAKKEA